MNDRHPRRWLRRLRRDRRGVAALELGVIATILVPMFMSMYDVGMALYEELVISHAVRAGALYALYYNDPAGIQNVITNSMPSSWTDASITVTIPSSCLCMSASGISAAISCANSCTNGAVMEKLEMVSVSRPFSPLILTAITQISASDVIRYH